MTYNPKVVLAWMAEVGLPKPELEFRFCEERKFRFDFAWPEYMVYLEVEGGVWTRGAHGRGSGIVRDIDKSNLATEYGWRPLRVLPKNLCTQDTAKRIHNTLNRYGKSLALLPSTTGCPDSPVPH